MQQFSRIGRGWPAGQHVQVGYLTVLDHLWDRNVADDGIRYPAFIGHIEDGVQPGSSHIGVDQDGALAGLRQSDCEPNSAGRLSFLRARAGDHQGVNRLFR